MAYISLGPMFASRELAIKNEEEAKLNINIFLIIWSL